MNIIEKLEWRYATKKFDSKTLITKGQLDVLKAAFNLTATSYGLQPIKLVIISDKELQKELVQYSMDQEQVAEASHVLVFCTECNIDKAYIETYFKRVQQIRHTPNSILNPFKEFLIDDFNNRSIENIKNWAIKQAYLAMGNLLTVCAIEGIDACPMEGFEPSAYDELLLLKEKGLESALVMPIGYRAEDDMFASFKKVRKEIKNSIIEI
ncbi:nitroreductase family protein [Pontimicrobium sp. SW4]|uniref:Nitroreductase family protein n=1 Tax=Pontimicrobium sp. SW4 TaxID=3153519 RepID=A0AAU7BVU2_9FLAO